MCDLHLQIIDCHIHIRGTMSSIANMIDVMRACNLSGMNVLSVASQGGENTTQNVVGLLSKALYPGQMYAFGALQYSLPGDHQNHPSFAEQTRRLMQMGADGMKMGYVRRLFKSPRKVAGVFRQVPGSDSLWHG
jgi:hypothetical protein